jgi:hypothetical protein
MSPGIKKATVTVALERYKFVVLCLLRSELEHDRQYEGYLHGLTLLLTRVKLRKLAYYADGFFVYT